MSSRNASHAGSWYTANRKLTKFCGIFRINICLPKIISEI